MEPAFLLSSTGCVPTSRLRTERIGRDGALTLAFDRRGAQTILTERRFTLPFQVLEPVSLHDDGFAYLTLLNPTGGLVGGDRLEANIILNAGARVCLTTPSATKVYRTLGPPAVQRIGIRVDADAVIEYVPDHVIPYPGSAFHQYLQIELAERSRALIYDAFAVGRVARGERWAFKEFINRTAVTLNGRPIFLDRFELDQSVIKERGFGGMENYGYIATVGLFAESFCAWNELAHRLQKELRDIPSVASGVSLLARCGCIVRVLAPSAVHLGDVTRKIWALAREALLGLPVCDLRKF